ncbi:MAG: UxaA family hydrolase [Bryobacteraceae bacterium]|jgi:hypothetical protein
MKRCLQIHASDNVATLLEDAGAEAAAIVGSRRNGTVILLEPIQMGHKVALQTIPKDGPVVKYGVTIGLSLREIQAGEWVHLHNTGSRVDDRSSAFDERTGAARDTTYE